MREEQSAYTLIRLIAAADNIIGRSDRAEERAFRLQPSNVCRVAPFFSEWPTAAQRALGPALASLTPRQRTSLKSRLRMEELVELQAALAFCFYTPKEIRKLRPRRTRPTEKGPPKGLMTLQCYQLHVGGHQSSVRRLFEAGAFAGSAMSIDGLRVPWISEEELQAGLAIKRQAPTMREAARFLHCPTKLLAAMNNHGLLPAVIDHRVPWVIRFRQTELTKLVDAFARRVRGTFEASEDFISVPQLSPTSARHAQTWFQLFDAIRCRKLPIFHAGAPALALANFAVLRSDVRPFKDALRGRWGTDPSSEVETVSPPQPESLIRWP